jgi:N-acyl-D-amino-acid deacylase
MADPALAAKVHADVLHEVARRGGLENIVVLDFPDRSYVGRSLADLASTQNLSAVELAVALQERGFRDRPGGARLRGFSVWEDDVDAFMRQPWTATSTDAGVVLPEDGADVHARFYGSYPRKLRRYALERRVLSLEDAIRSSTSLPAQILGLRDRGVIRAGLAADVVVFDPAKVQDNATFVDPHQHSSGLELVLINGVPVVDAGRPTGARPGRVLSQAKSSDLREQ